MNLLVETVEAIELSGHDIWHIEFIGSLDTGHRCTWDEFMQLADQDYNNSWGSVYVMEDLVILFDDNTKLFRAVYDGKEWWEYSYENSVPNHEEEILTLFMT